MPNDDKYVNKKMMWHIPYIHSLIRMFNLKNAPLRAKSSRIQNKVSKISDTYHGSTPTS